jgi:hypothetical protein
MNGQKQGTKSECLAFLDKIKGMGYVVVSYSLVPIDADKNIWSISITYKIK